MPTGCGYGNHTRIHTSSYTRNHNGTESWCREKPADARLNFCPWSAETQAARGDEPVRVWPTRLRSVLEVEANRGCWYTAAQQARPGGEVGKIEKGIGTS